MKKIKVGLWMYTNEFGFRMRQELVSALENEGYDVVYDFDMRECYILNGCVFTRDNINLSDLDVMYYMNADECNQYQHEILYFLKLSGVKMINDIDAYYNAKDKAKTNFILTRNKLKTPPSLLIPANFPARFFENIFDEWGSIVLKKRTGSGGQGIVKFDDYESFRDFYKYIENCFDDFYIEKFIGFSSGDYRVGLFDDEVIEIYSRKKSLSFKTNIHEGCEKVFPIKHPEKFIEIAKKAAKILGITTTIIDMVISDVDNEIYILEVNDNMGIFLEAYRDYLKTKNIKLDLGDIKTDQLKIEKIVAHINKLYKKVS